MNVHPLPIVNEVSEAIQFTSLRTMAKIGKTEGLVFPIYSLIYCLPIVNEISPAIQPTSPRTMAKIDKIEGLVLLIYSLIYCPSSLLFLV